MEHGKLHIPVNGVDVDFYPETCFDDVIDTGTDLTLTQTLASVNQSITAEATARANADAALDDKIALKVATSTYDAKMLRLDESISSLSTNKLDASTYNTKMASLDGSISGLESNKADKSTTYTKTEADELYDGKLDKSGGTLTGNLINRNVATDLLTIVGGTGDNSTPNGAKLTLSGASRSSSAGNFWLTATNGTDKAELAGYPNGTLNWNGKGVLTSAGGTVTGVIRGANGQGALKVGDGNYGELMSLTSSGGIASYVVCYSPTDSDNAGKVVLKANDGNNATFMQLSPNGTLTWGGYSVYTKAEIVAGVTDSITNGVWVSFPRLLKSTPCVVATVQGTSSADFVCKVYNVSNAGFTAYVSKNGSANTTSLAVHWIAIVQG